MHSAEGAQSQGTLFECIEAGARVLGFDRCAYGLRVPVPVCNPRTVLLNSHPGDWRARYLAAGYIRTDPAVLTGRRSQGLCFGWAKSNLGANGVGGMLTLARSSHALSEAELAAKSLEMCWLAQTAHLTLSRLIVADLADETPTLTEREIEVMKWTADGKTSGEIAEILAVSDNTVNFHIKNAVAKLRTANKTAAAVRAALLGLFN